MCGICGTVNWGERGDLDRMLAIQQHRGPDDRGAWAHVCPDGSRFTLGNTRLSIIDLSSAGQMPMANEDGTVWITYNGEIYNAPELRAGLEARGHSFRSRTDTEVVLHLYEEQGVECLNRLNGMFAFGVCDLRHGTPRIFLARDHFGIKPLYYVRQGRQFAFASEAKALLQLPGVEARINPEALDSYLTFLWVPDPDTLFDGIYKLPAGHYALFEGSELHIVEYWDLQFPPTGEDRAAPEEQICERVRELLQQSVRRQMVADVPVGAFLSAGMDSSSIVRFMANDRPRVSTYTITFPRKLRVGEHTLDDPAVPRMFAKTLGCNHHEIVLEANVVDLLPRLVWHMDEPAADPALIATYFVCRAASSSATVLLSGTGGDELFAGYRKHYAYYWSRLYRSLPAIARRWVIEPAVRALPPALGTRFKDRVRLLKKMARSGSLCAVDAFLMNSTYLDRAEKNGLYSRDIGARLRNNDPWNRHRDHFRRVSHADFLNQMLYLDTKAFLVSLNLTYMDKMSMACSTEVRVPFLDRELVEFAAAQIPPRMKLHGTLLPTTKYILRKAMAGLLPPEVLHQRKAAFGAPLSQWIAGELQEMVDDLLCESRVRRTGYLEPEGVSRMISEHRDKRRDWSLQIWQLLTFELWAEAFLHHPVASRLAATESSVS